MARGLAFTSLLASLKVAATQQTALYVFMFSLSSSQDFRGNFRYSQRFI